MTAPHAVTLPGWQRLMADQCPRGSKPVGIRTVLEARVAAKDTWPKATAAERRRWRTQYECLIAAASWIDPPTVWPEVQP